MGTSKNCPDLAGSGVWADAAYRSDEMEAKLRARKLKSHIHRKGKPGKPLTAQAKGSTRRAIRRYQDARQLPVSGYLDRATGLRLMAETFLR